MTSGQTAVITGASAGVGRACVRAFADAGYDVAVLARGTDGLAGALKDAETRGVRAMALEVDVADWSAVDDAARRIEDELGPIDVWVNNAMTTVFSRFVDVEPDEFRRATDVTYLGQVFGTKAALARMRPRDRGVIVNVGSALAFVGIPLQSAYCGAKFAARGFTQSVATELLDEGSNVRIATVHLPAVNTPQFGWCRSKLPNQPQPVPPIYQPEVAAREILHAAQTGRRSKLLGTWNSILVWAARLVPTTVSHYAARTGVSSQQTDEPAQHDRAGNLFAPMDGPGGGDHGAHGNFDTRANGVLDPSFLRALPKVAVDLGRSTVAAAQDRLRHR